MDSRKKSAAAELTDDLIVDILSRLPAKSICRFKCVSRHWYALITNPEYRKKIPQTLSGFFYPSHSHDEKKTIVLPDFVDIIGDEELPLSDHSLTFMTGYKLIFPKICCNGLLFCLCWKVSPSGSDESEYVVCNPATEKWFVLPGSDYDMGADAYRFGFDPAISPHFHVFQFLEEDEDFIAGVNIYSSETGAWSHKENGWGNELQVVESRGVFFNGILHLLSYNSKILAVDTGGKTWRSIPLPETMTVSCFCRGPLAFIGQSQGRLYYINTPIRDRDSSKLSVWILEDYGSDEWIFKYNISTAHIFREKKLMFERDYALIAIHPECNLVFFVWRCEDMLVSYDMDRGKVCVICNLKERHYDQFVPYLPYVPFLSDSLAGHD